MLPARPPTVQSPDLFRTWEIILVVTVTVLHLDFSQSNGFWDLLQSLVCWMDGHLNNNPQNLLRNSWSTLIWLPKQV